MPQKAEYKIVSGTTGEINKELSILGMQGWRPILMNSVLGPKGIMVTVIFEHALGS